MKNKESGSILLVTILYILFTQFYHLGELPIVQWDESRLAVNAAEMSLSGNFLVTTFEHTADLYNTKPPLMIWLQVLSIDCFGMNEFAIRFPSACAGFLTILLVGSFVYKTNKNIYLACLAMLILTTCDGFINLHGSITGDYDSLLTLFLMLSIYSCYSYLLSNKNNHLYAFTFFVAMAVLTKSAAAMIFFPVYFILFFYWSKFKNIGKLSLALFVALVPFILFCILREQVEKGYLEAIWQNDFGGRFVKCREGNCGEWHYYIVHLFKYRFSWFIWLLPLAVFYGFYKRNREMNFMSIILLVYLLIVSSAGTKLEWYDIPAMPVISILLALFLFDLIKTYNSKLLKTGCCILIIVCLSWSVFSKFKFTYYRDTLRLSMDIYYISEVIRYYKETEKLYYYKPETYASWLYFYTLVNPSIERVSFDSIKPGQKIFTYNSFTDSIKRKFQVVILDSTSQTKTIRIAGARSD